MAKCFWNVCDCLDPPPDLECYPCDGFTCGMFGGRYVSSESEVNDAVTQRMQTALDKLGETIRGLEQRAEKMREELREAKERVEDLKTKAGAAGMGNAGAAQDDLDAEMQQLRVKKDRLLRELDVLDREILEPGDIQWAKSQLRVPFSDPAGFCTCYQAKQTRLRTLWQNIQADEAHLYDLVTTVWPNARGQLKAALVTIAIPSLAGFFVLARIVWWMFLGGTLTAFPLVALAFTTMATMVTQFYFMCKAYEIAIDMAAARERIGKAILSYYRVQQITTCQKPAEDENDRR